MAKVRVGFIGAGGLANHYHYPSLAEDSRVELAAICDLDEAKLNRTADKYGVAARYANHQEMLLRIYWDGRERPGVEAPVGDFFANCFAKRCEVTSLPVIVEDADSYNCFWHMPFRKSARVEVVNQGEKPVNLLYYGIDWVQKERLPKETERFAASLAAGYSKARKGGRVAVHLCRCEDVSKPRGFAPGQVLLERCRSIHAAPWRPETSP